MLDMVRMPNWARPWGGPLALMAFLAAGAASGSESAHMPLKRSIAAPDGFGDVCDRYDWACARGASQSLQDAAVMVLARQINQAVNRAYRQVTDDRQYGVEEFWALPTKARGGDCEDFALAKKQQLIKAGVGPGQLLLATALDRRQRFHAVLVLRLESGDFVLDNLNNRIRPWDETGYAFLRIQNPGAPAQWTAVFSGGALG